MPTNPNDEQLDLVLWLIKSTINSPTPPASVALPQAFIDQYGGIDRVRLTVNKLANARWGGHPVVDVTVRP